MRVIECIEKRRSTRAYSERAVEKEKLEQIVRSAYWHRPEGTNRRCVSSCFRMSRKTSVPELLHACLEAGEIAVL